MNLLFATLVAAATATPITAPGPHGPLAGTWIAAGEGAPIALILPGSGPTDRDGNNPMGVSAQPYRLLAEALAARGVASVRIDKRGLFGSRAAVADPNAVTLADYAADARSWIDTIREASGASCVWLFGHSEGGLIALLAAQQPASVCGVALLATPGRRVADVLRAQLQANPANAPLLPAAMRAIAELEAGRRVDAAGLPAPLQGLFAAQVQGFLMDLMRADPAALAATLRVPLLVVQGGQDLQVSEADARALAAGRADATLVVLPRVNHVLKEVEGEGPAANLATYADPGRPVAPAIVDALVRFAQRP